MIEVPDRTPQTYRRYRLISPINEAMAQDNGGSPVLALMRRLELCLVMGPQS